VGSYVDFDEVRTCCDDSNIPIAVPQDGVKAMQSNCVGDDTVNRSDHLPEGTSLFDERSEQTGSGEPIGSEGSREGSTVEMGSGEKEELF